MKGYRNSPIFRSWGEILSLESWVYRKEEDSLTLAGVKKFWTDPKEPVPVSDSDYATASLFRRHLVHRGNQPDRFPCLRSRDEWIAILPDGVDHVLDMENMSLNVEDFRIGVTAGCG